MYSSLSHPLDRIMGLFSRLGQKSKDRAQESNEPQSKDGRLNINRRQKLQKRNTQDTLAIPNRQQGINELGERTYSVFSEASTLVADNRPRDHTEMLHGLAHHGSFDSLVDRSHAHLLDRDEKELSEAELMQIRRLNDKHQRMLKSLPFSVWKLIINFLNPTDVAHLVLASKTFFSMLGKQPLHDLILPENRHHRIRFLNHLDRHFPNHLLCFPCGAYHLRVSPGTETLKAEYIHYPLYICPQVFSSYLPRMRLTHGRELPYSFIQLATRHATHSQTHGIHHSALDRRWRDAQSGWSHQSRYMIHDSRLLLRLRSQIFAPPNLTTTGERHLLYERENYVPYFSVCAHWRDGDLMKIVKCALSHVPAPAESYVQQLKKSPALSRSLARPGYIVRMCDECRPARRCPECPTEYLVEITMTEDKSDPMNRFKHTLVVTRWSDLGDGSSPTSSPEYCAVNGIKNDRGYDSFSSVGRRAVAGIFESKMSGAIPGQRMISLNPKNKKLGEDGTGWY